MKWIKAILLIAAPLILFSLYILNGINAVTNVVGDAYYPSDEESLYLASASVARGGGIAENYSIVYPPGRFLAQAFVLQLVGDSVPTTRLYANAVAPGIFLFALFYLTFLIVKALQNRSNFILPFASAVGSVVLSESIIHSAQESHAIVAIFFVVLFSRWKHAYKHVLLGALFGLVWLFRIDSGILLTLSLIPLACHENRRQRRTFLLGAGVVWIPVIVSMILTSSLGNFVHDSLYLGLIVQPRQMGLPIPPPPLGTVFLASCMFIIGFGISSVRFAKEHLHSAIQKYSIALVAFIVLSFVAALGRSDEAHLWYALVFLPVAITMLFAQLRPFAIVKKSFVHGTLAAAVVIVSGYFFIHIGGPKTFIVGATLLLWSAYYSQTHSTIIALATIVVTLYTFHSVSYLSLRFIPPRKPVIPKVDSALYTNEGSEIAGLEFSSTYLNTLEEIQNELGDDQYVFIYPDHTILYEYFIQSNPTRYNYLNGEKSVWTEESTIKQIEDGNTRYVLFFPNRAEKKQGVVYDYILARSEIVSSHMLGEEWVQVRSLR